MRVSVKKTLGNFFRAMMRGELVLRLRFDKLLVYIIYFFIVCWISIFIYLRIDQTVVKMEKNKAVLEDLQIYHAQKTCELARYNRMSTVEEMLEKSGSDVRIPQKPARRVKDRRR